MAFFPIILMSLYCFLLHVSSSYINRCADQYRFIDVLFLGCGHCNAMKKNYYEAAKVLEEENVRKHKLRYSVFSLNMLNEWCQV